MQFTRFPLIALTVSAMAATSQAQVSTRVYNSVDTYGRGVRTTVQTPLADARSIAGLIAQQGILGSNTTTSTSVTYGNAYGNIASGYYPPAVVYGQPVYPYPYGYGYQNNYNAAIQNHYYPALPTTGPIAPPDLSWSRPAWVTSIPLGNQYNGPAYGYNGYGGYGYRGNNYPNYPIYGGNYNNGASYGTIVPNSDGGYTYGVGVQGGGIPSKDKSTNTTSNNNNMSGSSYRRARSTLTNPPPILPPGVKPNLILPR